MVVFITGFVVTEEKWKTSSNDGSDIFVRGREIRKGGWDISRTTPN